MRGQSRGADESTCPSCAAALDAAAAYAFLFLSQVPCTDSEGPSCTPEEQHEKGRLVVSGVGAEWPSSAR